MHQRDLGLLGELRREVAKIEVIIGRDFRIDYVQRACLEHHVVRKEMPESHANLEELIFRHVAQLDQIVESGLG